MNTLQLLSISGMLSAGFDRRVVKKVVPPISWDARDDVCACAVFRLDED